MQLGISTYTYGWAIGTVMAVRPAARPPLPMDEQALIDRAVQFGVQIVQFGDNLPLHELSKTRLTALKQRCQAGQITLELGARGLTPAHLQHYVELANHLGARLLRFVIDAPAYEPAVDEIVAVLRAATPLLHRYGIVLGLENHDRLKAPEFADIVQRVGNGSVGICLDSVNSMGAGEGLAEVVQTLAPYTVNLHVKDLGIGRLPHLMGFQIDGRIAGQGMLNIPWLLAQLKPYGRCQTAVLEQWVVPESSLPETIAKEERWAEMSIEYLKHLNLFS